MKKLYIKQNSNNPSTAARGGLFVTRFTLIELLVVIIILGILAAIAVPRYISATNRAKATEAIQQMGVLIYDIRGARTTDPSGTYDSLNDVGYSNNWSPSGAQFTYNFTGNILTATAGDSSIINFNLENETWAGNNIGVPPE